MSEKETRRMVPLAYIATGAVVILVIFELVVIWGAFELQPSTVARVVPWAYEPFLKLIGEHPDSLSEEPDMAETTNGVMVAGFRPEELSVTLDPDRASDAHPLIDPTIPLEGESRVVPVVVPPPAVDPADVVPVG